MSDTKIIKSIKDIENLIKLAKKYEVDLIECEGHKIVITRFNTSSEAPVIDGLKSTEVDEADLYWSAE